jgi:very-short-patch-repair endonuclease
MTSWQERAQGQDGVLSRAQAVHGGLSEHAWQWRLHRDWQRVLPGVAVTHTGPLTDRQRAWAAVLYAGRGAALSGDAALQMHGMTLSTSALDVAVPGERRAVDQLLSAGERLTIRRVTRLGGLIREQRELPLVTPHVAVLHAAAWAETDKVAELRVAAAIQQRRTAVPLVRAALDQMPRLPRRALLRLVLDDVELGAHAGSELQYLRFCRAHRLPLPDELQVRVRVGAVHYLDARYRRQRVTVELDGAHHRDVGQWEADALRTLRVVATMPGERVLRLTMGMLRHDGDEVAGLLRGVLG